MNIGVFLAYNWERSNNDNGHKKDLVELGYGTSFSADIIKSKRIDDYKGHIYYQSRKLDRVPREAVEEILGIRFSNENRSE